MIKKGCQCFTCRHGDEPRVVAGYLKGYIDASNWFLNWAKRNNIKQGSIADDDLAGIVAQMNCNCVDSGCYLSCLPDIEKEMTSIQIRDIIPFMPKDSYVCMQKNGDWYSYGSEPELREDLGQWLAHSNTSCCLSNAFCIEPVEDWTKSLIKVGENND